MINWISAVIYFLGFRPGYRSIFYSYDREVESQWRTGKR